MEIFSNSNWCLPLVWSFLDRMHCMWPDRKRGTWEELPLIELQKSRNVISKKTEESRVTAVPSGQGQIFLGFPIKLILGPNISPWALGTAVSLFLPYPASQKLFSSSTKLAIIKHEFKLIVVILNAKDIFNNFLEIFFQTNTSCDQELQTFTEMNWY